MTSKDREVIGNFEVVNDEIVTRREVLLMGNLGGKGGPPAGPVEAALSEHWGSPGRFMDYLKAAGKCMRGWVIVGYNTRGGHIQSYGLDLHNMWVPANVVPLLVLDVYEHAY